MSESGARGSSGETAGQAAGATDQGVAVLYQVDTGPGLITPAAGQYSQGKVDGRGVQWTRVVDNNGNDVFSGRVTPGDGTAAIASAPVTGFALGYGGASSLWVGVRIATVFKNVAAVAITAGTPVTVWTPQAGLRFRLMGFALSLTVAGSILFKDATTEFLRTPLLIASTPFTGPPLGNGIRSTTVNNVLALDATASGTVSGFVFGVEE